VWIQFEGEEIIYGAEAGLRTLLKHFPQILNNGQDTELVNNWLEFSLTRLGGKDFKATSTALEELDNLPSLRTFLVGHIDTIADIAVYGALNANNRAITTIKRNHLPNLMRSPREGREEDGFLWATGSLAVGRLFGAI
jgi:glutamyl-tRNA synthetase